MGDTNDYRMTTIDSVLRRSLDDRSGDLVLTLDPAFQGLPDAAHGGSVLAAFDALAGLSMPRAVSGVYRKRIPLATPLRLAVDRDNGAHTFVLRDSADVLAHGRVAPLAPDARARPWRAGASRRPVASTRRQTQRKERADSTILRSAASPDLL